VAKRKTVDSPKRGPAKATRQRKAAINPVLDDLVKNGPIIQNGQAVSEDAIRLSAYQKWEAAGKPPGQETKFWLEAEKELVQRSLQSPTP
jgi:hypothetical protein